MKLSSCSSEDTFEGFTHNGPVSYVNMSQEEVAKLLGVSRMTIYRIEKKALLKLRLALLEELYELNPELCLRIIKQWKEKHDKKTD